MKTAGLLILALILSVLMFGCITVNGNNPPNSPANVTTTGAQNYPQSNDNYPQSIEQSVLISVSGVNQSRVISESAPVLITVSGTGNNVEVLDGTEVTMLTLSGTNSTVTLPKGATPQITQSGVNNIIKYR